ncbi:hypothetical protein BaRGS_00003846, partial [Batillaria attramentaria]
RAKKRSDIIELKTSPQGNTKYMEIKLAYVVRYVTVVNVNRPIQRPNAVVYRGIKPTTLPSRAEFFSLATRPSLDFDFRSRIQ